MASISTMSQEDWIRYKARLKQQLNNIQIPLDANTGMIKSILSSIDKSYTNMRLEFSELEGHREKTESIIREWEREKAVGKNEIDRKRNATVAIQNYPGANGQVINLYEFHRQIVERHLFLKGTLDALIGKQNRLITFNGMLKLEQGTSPYSGEGSTKIWED